MKSNYEVTLRRDVQQVWRARVEASSSQEAIDIAEAFSPSAAWEVEEHIGAHKPEVRTTPESEIPRTRRKVTPQ